MSAEENTSTNNIKKRRLLDTISYDRCRNVFNLQKVCSKKSLRKIPEKFLDVFALLKKDERLCTKCYKYAASIYSKGQNFAFNINMPAFN